MKDSQRKAIHAKKKNKFGHPIDTRYDIVRIYHPSQNRTSRIVKSNVSGDVAHAHVNDPKTSVKNRYFDGFERRN